MTRIWILVFVACAGLLPGCGGAPDEPESAPPLIFVGIDGAEWAVIDALIAAGDLPNLAALRERGAWGHLVNPGPLSSPVAWTTFATGQFGRRHGILDFVYPYTEGGTKRPVNALDKREPAIWNIATAAGKRVSVLGYFVTHPAEPINGVMISDRATQYLPDAIAPADAVPLEAIDYWEKGEGRDALLDRFFPWYRQTGPVDAADEGLTGAAAARAYLDDTNALRILKRDGFVHARTMALLADQPDILVTYYRSPDVMSHSLWKFHEDDDFSEPADPNLIEHLGGAVTDAYRLVDDYLGELVATASPDTRFILVSDHGMGSATGIYASRRSRDIPVTGNHRSDGIVVAAGPDIEPGEIIEMNALDVFPTMMALVGLPVSDELPGAVRTDIFAADLFDRQPLTTVPRYDAAVRPELAEVAIDAEAEQATMETLQGLGYIGGDVGLDEGVGRTDLEVWDIAPRLFAGALVGEAVFHLLEGDEAATRTILAEVAEYAPDRDQFFRRQLGMRGRAVLQDAPLTDATRASLTEFLDRETPDVSDEFERGDGEAH